MTRRVFGSANNMKRSALFHFQKRAGAKFVERYDWEMPFSFTEPQQEESQVRTGVGLTDLSYRTKFDTKIEPAQFFWYLGKNHYLVVADPPLDPPGRATDVTGVYANLFLAGPQTRPLLSKLTSLNVSATALPNLSCAQTSVAQAHAIILREDIRALPGFHLLISREYAESVWEAIVHCGREFRLQPFGLEALTLLRN
jgi:glycine cleavage system aminomethyltransferase T